MCILFLRIFLVGGDIVRYLIHVIFWGFGGFIWSPVFRVSKYPFTQSQIFQREKTHWNLKRLPWEKITKHETTSTNIHPRQSDKIHENKQSQGHLLNCLKTNDIWSTSSWVCGPLPHFHPNKKRNVANRERTKWHWRARRKSSGVIALQWWWWFCRNAVPPGMV